MLKKAKIAFLLIMALVFALQSVPVAQAEVIDKLTAEYIFDSLGDALNYGTVAREWEQRAHAETSVCVDDWERFSDEVFANSDNTYFHAMAYDLEAEISASKSLQGMTFALYRETANGYERCEGTENTISDNTTSTVLTWRIGEELKNTRLYVFRTNGDGYIQEGSQVGLDMKLTYGPSVGASAQNENYIGKIIYHTKKGEGDTLGVFNTSDYSPTLVFGPETRAYYKKWNQELQKDEYFVIDPNNKNLIVDDSNGSVLVNYYYSDKADYDPAIDGDSNLQMGYMKLDGLSFVNGVFYRGGGNGQPGKIIHVRYVDEDSYADKLVTNAEKFSKELGNMGGGELNSVVVNPDGGSSVTGPVDAEGHVVSIYDIEVGTTETQKDSKTGEECYVFTLDQSSKHPDASVDGIPVANNEYVIVNLICPSKDCAVMMTKVQYYHEGGKDDQVKWGSADSNSSQRVIYNFVYADENGVMQPFEGTIIPHNGHGGTLLAPKAFVHLTQNVHNGSIIADKVNNGQEIHQRTLAPLGRRTWVKMDGGYITLEKASLGYNWSVGAWQDMSAKTSLAGAVFGVYSSSSCSESSLVTTMTTNAQGVATSEMVAAGTYWVKEITPLKDHELNTDVVKVTVVAGQEPTKVQGGGYSDGYIWVGPGMYDYEENWIIEEDKFVNQQNEGVASLRLEKVDELGNVLPGAVFGIYDDSRCRTQDLVGTMKTNINGVAVYEGLPLRFEYGYNGSKTPEPYYVKEISAPEGYVASNRVATVRLTEDDRNKMVTVDGNGNADGKAFTNSIIRGNLALKKVDAYTGAGLQGAEFTIYSDKDCTQPVGKVMITDANGVATSANVIEGEDGLIPGTYYVLETTAPDGYALPNPNNAYEVKVVSGKLVDVANRSAEINSADESTGIANQQIISISGTKSWHDDDNKWSVRPQSIKVNLGRVKYNPDGSSYMEFITSATVDASNDWAFSFTDLPRFDGTEEIEYRVEEQMDGSVSNNYYTYATAETDDQGNMTVEIANSIKKTKINGQKRWEDTVQNEPSRPNSIKFTLYQLVDGKEVQVFDQWGNPLVSTAYPGQYTFGFENLPSYDANGNQAKYVVKEEESDKYVVVSNVVSDPKEDENGNTTITVAIKNRLTVPLRGTKVWNDNSNAQNTRPENVTLKVFRLVDGEARATEVRASEYTIVWDKETNSDVWTWEIQGLPKYHGRENKLCSYYVTETSVGGYQAPVYSNPSVDVTDKALDGGTITNNKVGRIRLYKESDSETENRLVDRQWKWGVRKRLAGAEFRLYADEACTQEVLADRAPFKTNDRGEIGKLEIRDVPYGTYWLKEVKAPDGYVLNEKPYKVVVNSDPSDVEGDEVNQDNNTDKNVVLNSKTSTFGALALKKTDADTGAPISGVVFTVYSDEACNTSVGTMTEKDATNNPGVYTLENLSAGTYYVKETVPEGYRELAADHKYTVTVEAGKTINVAANGTVFDAATATPITNKAITSVSVEKVWVNVAEGTNLPSIQVKLYKNGTEPVGEAVTLPFTRPDNTQSWSYTWENLDKYVEGTNTEIVYTVDEVEVPENYIKTVATEGNAVTITNTYVDSINVPFSAKKTLEGSALADGQFTFQLLDKDNNVVETKANDGSGNVVFVPITYTLADMKATGADAEMAEVKANGGYYPSKTFTYTIQEVVPADEDKLPGVIYDSTVYTAEVRVTCNASAGTLSSDVAYKKNGAEHNGDLVFANTTEKVSISVEKVWVDAANNGALRPEKIQVQLYNTNNTEGTLDDTPVGGIVELPATDGNWSYTWTGLDKYVAGTDTEIVYTVDEVEVPGGYFKTIESTANGFVIKNTLAQGNYNIEVDKTLLHAADLTEAKDFTFELYKYKVTSAEGQTIAGETVGEALATQTVKIAADTVDGKATATLQFPLEYGDNWFLLKEVADATDTSITYADNEYIINIWAAVDMNGNLGTNDLPRVYDKEGKQIVNENASCDYSFENTYNVTRNISVTKVWANTDENAKLPSIKVQLYKDGVEEGSPVTLPTEKGWSYTWTDLPKYEAGATEPIEYTVVEITTADGAALPWTTEYVPGAATGSMDDGFTITNTKIADGQTHFEVTKAFNGTLTAGQFSFALLDENGVAVKDAQNNDIVVTNAADGKVEFPVLTFDTVGTYKYQIKEIAGNDSNIIYDGKTVNVEVTVALQDGQLVAAVKYDGQDTASFTNTLVGETTVVLEARKTLNGADYSGAEFAFELKDSNGTKETVRTVEGGKVVFAPITYKLADLKDAQGNIVSPKTFTYTISEVPGSTAGVTYSTDVYTAVVTLTYDADSKALTADVEYKQDGTPITDEVPVFANTSIELVDVSVTKVWNHGTNDKHPVEIDVILVVDGEPNYNRTMRLTANNNWAHTWSDLPKYGTDKDGNQYEIDYSVMESSVPNDYVSKLSANAKNDYVITNTYVEDDQELELTFPVTKIVMGNETSEKFTFKLEAKPSAPPAPMPENAVLGSNGYNYITTQTTGSAAGTTVNFDTIKVTSAKVKYDGRYSSYYVTYGWNISEVIPEEKKPNIIYDEGWYEILVDFCINEDGKLVIADREIWDEDWENVIGQEPAVSITHYDADGTTAEIPYNNGSFALPFTNTVFAPTEVELSAKKTLNGADYSGDEYTFLLKEGETEKDSVSTVSGGVVTFDTLQFTLADMKATEDDAEKEEVVANGGYYPSKTFTYNISEVAGTDANVIYDSTVYTAKVTVTCDASTGTLRSEVVYEKNGTPITGDVPVFANATEKVSVSVTKVWNDNNNAAGKRPANIQVQLRRGDDPVNTVELPHQGNWSYTWNDLPKYDINDQECVYRVVEITVDDNYLTLPWVEDYILGEPVETDGGFTITNTLIQGVGESIGFTKVVKAYGAPELNDTFTIKVEQVEGDTAPVSPAEKVITLNETGRDASYWLDEKEFKDCFHFAFDKAGTYVYKLYEAVESPLAGATYDEAVHRITFTVSPSATEVGKLECSYVIEKYENGKSIGTVDEIELLNEYVWRSISVKKNWDDENNKYKARPESIQVQLKAGDDSLGEPVTLNAANSWSYTWNNLLWYSGDKEINYTVEEITKAGDNDWVAVYDLGDATGSMDNGFVITNTYVFAERDFLFLKLLDGQPSETAFQFDVVIDSADTDNQAKGGTVTNMTEGEAAGYILVGPMTYGKDDLGKTYEYTVSEKPAEGYYHEDTEYTITVEIDNKLDHNGNMQIDVSLLKNGVDASEEDPLFKNASAITAELPVQKTLITNNVSDVVRSYSFTLTPKGATEPEQTISVTVGESQTGNNLVGGNTFRLSFDEPGTYTYTVKEITDTKPGYEYDTTEYEVTYKVDFVDGKLQLAAGYPQTAPDAANNLLAFTNRYEKLAGSATLHAKKVFTDGDLSATQFTFELLGEDGKAVLDKDGNAITATSNANGEVAFPDLHYDVVGTYKYVIKEKLPENAKTGGIVYDERSVNVTVLVEKVGNELKPTVTYDDSTELPVFTNTQLDATGKVYVKKNFVNNKTAAGDYTFTMTPVDNAPALANNTLTLTFGETTTEANGVFQLPTYTAPGTYKYTVQESTTTKDANIEYDSTDYTVVVTVARNDDKLVATVSSDDKEITEQLPIVFTNEVLTTSLSGTKVWANDKETDRPAKITIHLLADGEPTDKYVELAPTETEWSFTDLPVNDENGKPITYSVAEDAVPGYDTTISGTTITNTKISDGEAVIKAKKTLNNAVPAEGQFTFQLLDKDGKVVGEKTNDASGIVTFDKLTYTEAKDYTYTIVEVMPQGATAENNYTVNGMTYDPTEYTVTVKVEREGTALVTTVTYNGTSTEPPVFTNTYEAKEAELTLSLSKTLINGAELPVGRSETFTFVLADEAGAMQDEVELSFTKANGEPQTATFEKLTFDAEGTYKYTISEKASAKDDITSDTTKYYLEVKVDDVDGQLVATQTLTKQTGAENATSAEAIAFTNTYTAKVGELILTATKAMSGRPFQSDDSFTFTVAGSEGAPMPEKSSVTITPDSGNEATVDFGKINFTEADAGKEYTYTITENEGDLPGVTYDTTSYEVKVTVTNEVGKADLTVTADYPNNEDELVITNTYTANGELLLTGTKAVTGDSTVAEHKNAFTFGVFDASGAEIATGTNDEKGKIAFSRIAYELDQVGTYEYTVKETTTAVAAEVSDKYIVELDETEYTIQVSVVNNTATGNLDVTWNISEHADATELVFTNDFQLRLGNIGVVKVDSKDTTKGLSGAEFTVYTDEACTTILVLDGEEAIITTGETGAGALDDLPIGTYWVKETKAPQHYLLDDETVYEVIVVEGDRAMVNEANGAHVTNRKMAKLALEKSDRLNPDKKLPDAEYTLFTEEECENILELPDGTPAIITTGEDGVGELEGVPAGTYWVKETKAPEGYEVDPEPYEVVVPEEDDPENPVFVKVSDFPLRGALSLSKTVVASSEVTDTFLFDIELTLATDDPIVGSYKATLNGAETDDVTFAATETGAKATVELKDGETLTIIGLRSGVSYTVTEQLSSRYDVTVNGAEATAATGTITDNGHSIVKYQNTLKETGFTVEKVWLGEDAGEIKLTLYANGVAMDPQPEVTRDGNTYSYENLVMKDENGEEIVYTVKETAMAGYTTTYQNAAPNADKTDAAYNGGKIINQAMTTFAVKKEWSGLAQGEKAPAIQLTLYCNGKVYTAATPTPDKDGWYTYADLPAYVDGEVAVYTVKEQPVTGFTTTYINKGENAAVTDCAYNGSTIVNSKIPQTGDNTPLTLWMLTTLLAACGLMGVMATLRKREN